MKRTIKILAAALMMAGLAMSAQLGTAGEPVKRSGPAVAMKNGQTPAMKSPHRLEDRVAAPTLMMKVPAQAPPREGAFQAGVSFTPATPGPRYYNPNHASSSASQGGASATTAATDRARPAGGFNPNDKRLRGDVKENVKDSVTTSGMTGGSGRVGKDRAWQELSGGRSDGSGIFASSQDKKDQVGRPRFATGKYGDTFQGGRANGAGENPNTPSTAGHGQGRDPMVGRGQDRVGRASGSVVPFDERDNPPSKDSKGGKPAEEPWSQGAKETFTNAAIIVGFLVFISLPDPVPDGDTSRSSDPLIRDRTQTVSQQLRGVIKGQGTAGGPGLDRNDSSPGRNSGQAVQSGYVRGSDKEMKRSVGGSISYEQALKAIQYTNPGQK